MDSEPCKVGFFIDFFVLLHFSKTIFVQNTKSFLLELSLKLELFSRWKSEVENERRREEEKYAEKRLYQQTLKEQMEMREMNGLKHKEEEKKRMDQEERRRKEEQEVVERVKERKLQELQ